MINPESEVLSEPFTVTATPTLDGGLFVEENGIIARRITLTGTTGMRPRDNTQTGQMTSGTMPTVDRSYARHDLDNAQGFFGKVSGQKHFQLLQDRIFRNYADLKRNPATAQNTQLYLHVTRDGEHWRVVPESFTMRRDVRTRVLYHYQIDLLVVDRGDRKTGVVTPGGGVVKFSPSTDATEDFSVKEMWEPDAQAIAIKWAPELEAFLYDMGIVQAGVEVLDVAKPGLYETLERWATGLLADIQNWLTDNVVVNFVRDVARFAADVLQFINGVTSVIVTAIDVVTGIVATLDGIIDFFANIIDNIEAAILAAWRRLTRAFHALLARPDAFVQSPLGGAPDFRRFLTPPNNPVDDALARRAQDRPPGSVEAFGALGTGPTPGTARLNALRAPSSGPEQLTSLYSSTRCYTVTAGDSLPSIASNQLGDATRWWEIAQLNKLQAPYISDLALPMTVAVGVCILLPADDEPPENARAFATLGVLPSEGPEKQLLGTDYELREVSGTLRKPRFDWVVSNTKNDFVPVEGIPNLQQGIRTRLNETQGDHPLYPNLGTEPSIGRPNSPVDQALAAVRITRSVEADPRILTAQRLKLDRSGADVVGVEFDAVIRQFRDRRTINVAF